ncbi:MAG: methyltransferase domain-containing protein [Sphingobacteriia bacterium]|nr:methyltransferase domain-containing protein [Sphingobacteriia bacterium]
MPDKEWYKAWFNSQYYHLLYNNRDEEEATAFLKTLVEYLQPKQGALMLDVACGKGRHSKVLADMGFEVTGIDLSDESIEEAKKDESELLHFYKHDMRLPFWVNYFDYAFNFFTSFGYFRTKREHDNAIRSIAQSLKPGGLFVIDYLNVHYAEDHLEKSEVKEIGPYTFHITRWHDEDHFFKQIQIIDKAKNVLKHLSTERVAKFSLGDFTDMLAYQKLQVQEVFGDYHLNRFDIRKSPRMIIIARK